MNLKELKQSKYLVGIYIDTIANDNNLATCFHSIANQTLSVDLLILTNGLTSEQVTYVKGLAEKPYASYIERDEAGAVSEKRIDSEKAVNYTLVELDSSINFSKVFNTVFNAAKDNEYEGISLIEPQDGYSVKWFEVADIYSRENKDVAIFTPLIRNISGGAFSGVMNESPWVEGMAEEAGKFDTNLLQRYNCANPLGALYVIDKISESSEVDDATLKVLPMKESIKLSHYYEFFLRMVYDDVKVMTIPRIGYEIKMSHVEKFTDSSCKLPNDLAALSVENGGMSHDEARFWFELAKKEFFHEEDRKKVYELSV